MGEATTHTLLFLVIRTPWPSPGRSNQIQRPTTLWIMATVERCASSQTYAHKNHSLANRTTHNSSVHAHNNQIVCSVIPRGAYV